MENQKISLVIYCLGRLYSGRWLDTSRFPWFTMSFGPQNSLANVQSTKVDTEEFFLKYSQSKFFFKMVLR